MSDLKFLCKSRKRSGKPLKVLIASILFLNLLIGISNTSILNLGHNSLSVSFQNVQGLMPFSQLDHKSQLKLDQTKVFELNAYLAANKPDVLVINETWLN